MSYNNLDACMNLLPPKESNVSPVPAELQKIEYSAPGLYYICYAIRKVANGSIVGINTRILEIGKNGTYKLSEASSISNDMLLLIADRNGCTDTGKAVYNVTFIPTYKTKTQTIVNPDGTKTIKKEAQQQNGVTRGRYVGTMGDISRYPVYGLEGTPYYSRAFTILAYSPVLEYRKKVEVKGKNVTEAFVWERVPHYLIIDAEGNVGWITHEHALHLILTYKITNAQVRGKTLCPINNNYDNYTRTFPVVRYTSDAPSSILANEAYWSEVENPTHDGKMSASNAFHFAVTSANAKIRGITMVKLTPEETIMFRNVSDLVNMDPVQHALLLQFTQNGQVNDIEARAALKGNISRVNSIYRISLLSQSALPKDIKFMRQMWESISDSELGKLFVASKADRDAGTESCNSENLRLIFAMFHMDKDQVAKSAAFGDMLMTMKSIDAMYNVKIYSGFSPQLRSTYLTILRNEMQITQALNAVTSRMENVRFEGIPFRIKSPASLTEKVYERARLEDVSTKQAIEDLKDVLRYTLIFKYDSYVKDTETFILESLKSALELVKFANFWSNDNNPYNGINSALRRHCAENEIVIFEVQFHTQESFDLKNGEGHRLYEMTRAVDTDYALRKDCLSKAFELSNQLQYPPGVREFDMYCYVAEDIKARDAAEAEKKRIAKAKLEEKLRRQRLREERAALKEVKEAAKASNPASKKGSTT